MFQFFYVVLTSLFFNPSFTFDKTGMDIHPGVDTVHYPDERHFKNVRQLTFGGDNAEAYFSFDDTYNENLFEVAHGLGRSGEMGYTIGVRFNKNNKYGFGNNANVNESNFF
ncbi:MAG: hypothetical protein EOO04_15185, partial [Chitinophagaceae bacterium]